MSTLANERDARLPAGAGACADRGGADLRTAAMRAPACLPRGRAGAPRPVDAPEPAVRGRRRHRARAWWRWRCSRPISPLPNPVRMNVPKRFSPPGADFWFGTDHLGRDVFSRVVHGSAFSLTIGGLTILLAGVPGVLVGILAAAAPPRVAGTPDARARRPDVLPGAPPGGRGRRRAGHGRAEHRHRARGGLLPADRADDPRHRAVRDDAGVRHRLARPRHVGPADSSSGRWCRTASRS